MIYGHFRPRRHLMAAAGHRRVRAKAFRTWRQETCVHQAAVMARFALRLPAHVFASVNLAMPAGPFSPHGLRAGFITTAYRNGVPDEEIMGHTRHRSLTTMRSYVRRAKLSKDSPAGKLGL
jgi:integrase